MAKIADPYTEIAEIYNKHKTDKNSNFFLLQIFLEAYISDVLKLRSLVASFFRSSLSAAARFSATSFIGVIRVKQHVRRVAIVATIKMPERNFCNKKNLCFY